LNTLLCPLTDLKVTDEDDVGSNVSAAAAAAATGRGRCFDVN